MSDKPYQPCHPEHVARGARELRQQVRGCLSRAVHERLECGSAVRVRIKRANHCSEGSSENSLQLAEKNVNEYA